MVTPRVADARAVEHLMPGAFPAAATPAPPSARVILVTDQWLSLSDQPGAGFARLLEREGLACLVVGADAAELDRSAAYEPDIVLVRMTAAIDERIATLYRIRERFACPVVMLDAGRHPATSDALLTDELIALEAGFDDVWRETGTDRLLIARVRAHLRRGARPAAPTARGGGRVVLGGLVIDREGAVVKHAGRTIALTPAQLDALFLLARHQGRVVSREQIESACIGLRSHGAGRGEGAGERQRRAVDALISRLRARLALARVTSIEIRSVQGRGYRLGLQAPAAAADVGALRGRVIPPQAPARPRRAAATVE
jgi:DNA-binding response OmpR family regulator